MPPPAEIGFGPDFELFHSPGGGKKKGAAFAAPSHSNICEWIRNPCRPCRRPACAGAAPFFFGSSATIASVVISRPATEAAPWSAGRTTLVGSMMPLVSMLTYSPFCASKP